MLHRGASLYAATRSDDLLKLKPYDDAEAQVIAHLPGKGKYTGMVGALRVRTLSGTEFNVGSGLSDEQRRQPPDIGSWITYGYHGLTGKGIPRFARLVKSHGATSP
jgi:DNA ligase-1